MLSDPYLFFARYVLDAKTKDRSALQLLAMDLGKGNGSERVLD